MRQFTTAFCAKRTVITTVAESFTAGDWQAVFQQPVRAEEPFLWGRGDLWNRLPEATARKKDKKMPCSGGGMEQGGDPKGKGSACC